MRDEVRADTRGVDTGEFTHKEFNLKEIHSSLQLCCTCFHEGTTNFFWRFMLTSRVAFTVSAPHDSDADDAFRERHRPNLS